MSDYADTSQAPKINVFDPIKVETPAPKVVPAEAQLHVAPGNNHYDFPRIYVAQLTDASIYGGTNLVFMQDSVVCHDLYDLARDYTAEELHGRHIIDAKKQRIRLVRHDDAPEHIPIAATFTDACSQNYAHWLTEVLPRIAVFCSLETHRQVPIIIDDGLHRNIMESVSLVAGQDREVIILPKGRAITATALYVTSVTGYVPFDRRDTNAENHSNGMFSPGALDLVRKRVREHTRMLDTQSLPKRIYLRRSSNYRRLVNEEEIEKTLVEYGYTVLAPESLSFLQQAAVFERAESIISPTGASVTNAVFCPPESEIKILIGKHTQMAYRYWSNVLSLTGIVPDIVLGEIVSGHEHGVHGDFYVDSRSLI
jgi:capsular polysaccharide biosynthesis protein